MATYTCRDCDYFWDKTDFDSGKGRIAYSSPADGIKEGDVVCEDCYNGDDDDATREELTREEWVATMSVEEWVAAISEEEEWVATMSEEERKFWLSHFQAMTRKEDEDEEEDEESDDDDEGEGFLYVMVEERVKGGFESVSFKKFADLEKARVFFVAECLSVLHDSDKFHVEMGECDDEGDPSETIECFINYDEDAEESDEEDDEDDEEEDEK